MFGRYSERAQRVIILAQEEARRLNYNHVGTEHLLLGLIREGSGIAAKALQNLGVDLDQVRSEVEKTLGRGTAPPSGEIQFTPRGKKVIMELAIEQARALAHNYVGTEHILLGLIREGECAAAQLLQNTGADLARVRAEVTKLLGSPLPMPHPAPRTADPTPVPTAGRYSEGARRALAAARAEAGRRNHDAVGTEHLLLALLGDGAGIALQALQNVGVDLDQTRGEVGSALGRGDAPAVADIAWTPAGQRVITELADQEAHALGQSHVGPAHLLLGILREGDCVAARILRDGGAELERVRGEVLRLTGSGWVTSKRVAAASLVPRGQVLLRGSAVVFDGDRRLLLVQEGSLWRLPGGHPLPTEPLREVAARLAREATGLRLECGRLLWALETLGGPDGTLRQLEFVYLARVTDPTDAGGTFFARGQLPDGAALPPGFWEAADAGFTAHDPGASRRVPPPDEP